MPLYTYRCECGSTFEDLVTMANRAQSECIRCGAMAPQLITPTQLDPNMDTPGMKMKWRRRAEERGRGKDMTSANKDVADEGIVREAHANRQARGENPIIKS